MQTTSIILLRKKRFLFIGHAGGIFKLRDES